MILKLYCALFGLFLLLHSTELQAQHRIYGHISVSGSTDNAPFTTLVLIHTPDSTTKGLSYSDSTGNYHLETSSLANLNLVAQAAGYQNFSLPIKNTVSPVQRLDISLTRSAQKLDGVKISSQKPFVERKADRTILNLSSSISSIGSDALEVLKKAPGVIVTNSNIALAGKSTVNVMLNGRLIQLSGEELNNLLRSIPADNIDRIEIISAPPAKYDAAGNSGLINLITKKQTADGLNGSVTASYNQRVAGGGGLNMNFNYRHKKLNIYGVGYVFNNTIHPDDHITTFYPDHKLDQYLNENDRSIFNRIELGADYNLTKHSVIGMMYTLGNGSPQYPGDQTFQSNSINTNTGALDSTIITTAHSSSLGVRNVVNLNYENNFDTNGRKLNVDMDYFHRVGTSARDFVSQAIMPGGQPSPFVNDDKTTGRMGIDIRSLKADMEWPTSFAKFSFGGKMSFVHNTSDNVFEYRDGQFYTLDLGKTNSFDYHENTQALYFSMHKEWKEWEFQAGLRGEYTQTNGYSPNNNERTLNNYFRLFPTAYLQYKISEKQELTINYSRRIERPDFWVMNPFRVYSTVSSYEEGNPFLQPSYTNNIELEYALGQAFSVGLFVDLERAMFTQVSIVDTSTNSFHFTEANAGSADVYGMTVSGSLKIREWWECNYMARAYYEIFKSSYYNNDASVQYTHPGLYAQIGNTFTLNKSKTLTASFDIDFQSRQQSDFDLQYSQSAMTLGIRYQFFKKKFSIAATAFDPLMTERHRVLNLYNGTLQNSYYDNRYFSLALSWKFGSTTIKEKRQRQAGADEWSRAR